MWETWQHKHDDSIKYKVKWNNDGTCELRTVQDVFISILDEQSIADNYRKVEDGSS